ncbi:MAG: Hsp20 family protein [Bdellovibrionales bacterium]|nr:Hsp20 family protein [Bdellovibrionales bacterium]
MKPYLKSIGIPAISAVVGGAIVVLAMKMSPTLRAKIETPEVTHPESRDMVFDDIIKKQKGIQQHFDNIFNDDFFGGSDPFDDMKKMREQMRKRMDMLDNPGPMTNPFDSWFSDKFGGGSVDDIAKREDDDFVYYDIKVNDLNSTSVNTKIENGYITITGTVEKKSGSDDKKNDSGFSSQSIYKSTFNRTFPLPDHVDQNRMEMSPEKDKIVLKFPKVKT